MTKKRVAILTHEFPPLIGGVGTYCVEIASAAERLGYDVTLIAPDHGEKNESDANYPFKIIRFPMSGYRSANLLHLARTLLTLDLTSFDTVLIADWPIIVAMRLVIFVKDIKFRVILHGTDALLLNQGRVPKALRTGRIFSKADLVLANSRYTLSTALHEHPNIASRPNKVALLGVSPYWFERAGDARALRERLGIPADRRVILSVSRLDERKGHRHMLAALSRLSPDEKRNAVYVVVGKAGNAAYGAELKDLAEEVGLPVIFTGPLAQEDVRTLYSDAFLFLLLGEDRPDKVEGFGLVFLEAAAQGVPSLASPIGGVPEVVLEGETGRLVDWRDPAAAAEAIGWFLADPARRDALGDRGREWARTLTWERCAAQTFG